MSGVVGDDNGQSAAEAAAAEKAAAEAAARAAVAIDEVRKLVKLEAIVKGFAPRNHAQFPSAAATFVRDYHIVYEELAVEHQRVVERAFMAHIGGNGLLDLVLWRHKSSGRCSYVHAMLTPNAGDSGTDALQKLFALVLMGMAKLTSPKQLDYPKRAPGSAHEQLMTRLLVLVEFEAILPGDVLAIVRNSKFESARDVLLDQYAKQIGNLSADIVKCETFESVARAVANAGKLHLIYPRSASAAAACASSSSPSSSSSSSSSSSAPQCVELPGAEGRRAIVSWGPAGERVLIDGGAQVGVLSHDGARARNLALRDLRDDDFFGRTRSFLGDERAFVGVVDYTLSPPNVPPFVVPVFIYVGAPDGLLAEELVIVSAFDVARAAPTLSWYDPHAHVLRVDALPGISVQRLLRGVHAGVHAARTLPPTGATAAVRGDSPSAADVWYGADEAPPQPVVAPTPAELRARGQRGWQLVLERERATGDAFNVALADMLETLLELPQNDDVLRAMVRKDDLGCPHPLSVYTHRVRLRPDAGAILKKHAVQPERKFSAAKLAFLSDVKLGGLLHGAWRSPNGSDGAGPPVTVARAVVPAKSSPPWFRFTSDYGALNAASLPLPYHSPVPLEFARWNSTFHRASSFDMPSMFWWFQLDKRSQQLTGLSFGDGEPLCAVAMPQGLCGAPGAAQHATDACLADIPHARGVVDDWHLGHPAEGDAPADVRAACDDIMRMARAAVTGGFAFCAEKTFLARTQRVAVGYSVAHGRVEPTRARRNALLGAPPRTAKQVTTWCNMATVLFPFAPRLAAACGVLRRRFAGRSGPPTWCADGEREWNEAQAAVRECGALQDELPEVPLWWIVDFSKEGLSTIVAQYPDLPDDVLARARADRTLPRANARLIDCWSAKTTPEERNYDAANGELAAIVAGYGALQYSVSRRGADGNVLACDSQTVVLMRSPTAGRGKYARRQEGSRWLLQDFDYTPHTLRSDANPADYTSRFDLGDEPRVLPRVPIGSGVQYLRMAGPLPAAAVLAAPWTPPPPPGPVPAAAVAAGTCAPGVAAVAAQAAGQLNALLHGGSSASSSSSSLPTPPLRWDTPTGSPPAGLRAAWSGAVRDSARYRTAFAWCLQNIGVPLIEDGTVFVMREPSLHLGDDIGAGAEPLLRVRVGDDEPLVVPDVPQFMSLVLHCLHGSPHSSNHHAEETMVRTARARFFIPNVRERCKRFREQCVACNARKVRQASATRGAVDHSIPPRAVVQVDDFGPVPLVGGMKGYVLTWKDRATGRVRGSCHYKKDDASVAHVLHVGFLNHFVPVVVEGDTQFGGRVFRAMYDAENIIFRPTPPNETKPRGSIESSHGPLGKAIGRRYARELAEGTLTPRQFELACAAHFSEVALASSDAGGGNSPFFNDHLTNPMTAVERALLERSIADTEVLGAGERSERARADVQRGREERSARNARAIDSLRKPLPPFSEGQQRLFWLTGSVSEDVAKLARPTLAVTGPWLQTAESDGGTRGTFVPFIDDDDEPSPADERIVSMRLAKVCDVDFAGLSKDAMQAAIDEARPKALTRRVLLDAGLSAAELDDWFAAGDDVRAGQPVPLFSMLGAGMRRTLSARRKRLEREKRKTAKKAKDAARKAAKQEAAKKKAAEAKAVKEKKAAEAKAAKANKAAEAKAAKANKAAAAKAAKAKKAADAEADEVKAAESRRASDGEAAKAKAAKADKKAKAKKVAKANMGGADDDVGAAGEKAKVKAAADAARAARAKRRASAKVAASMHRRRRGGSAATRRRRGGPAKVLSRRKHGNVLVYEYQDAAGHRWWQPYKRCWTHLYRDFARSLTAAAADMALRANESVTR